MGYYTPDKQYKQDWRADLLAIVLIATVCAMVFLRG
jgi:hypothetical protein